MMNETVTAKPRPQQGRWGYRLLIFALLLAVVLIEILVLMLMENNFNFRKKEVIYDNANPLEEINAITSARPVRNLRFPNSMSREERLEYIKSHYGKVIELCSQAIFPAIRLELIDREGEVFYVWEAPDMAKKTRHFNTWKNSFLSRDFKYAPISRKLGHDLRVHLVTSPGLPGVVALVTKYRWYAVFFTLANVLVTSALYLGAIRPLGRIASALSVPDGVPPPIISNPRHVSERAYNKMARGTRLMTVHSDVSHAWVNLGERGTSHYDDPSMFWTPMLEVIRNGMGYRSVAWVPLEEGIPPNAAPASGGLAPGIPSTGPLKSALGITADSENSALESGLFYRSPDGGDLREERKSSTDCPLLIGPVFRKDEPVGVLVAEAAQAGGNPALELPYFKGLVLQLGLILTRTLEREEELDRERFEVSIDLSASMGHDLTNILATGRLELETMRTAYKRGILTVPENRKKAVEAALEGLRKTVVLLQEVVNVYRAFSFTRKPHLEQVDLNELVAEVIELYRHSTSRNVEYHLVNGDQPAVAFADPRVLKLVLFNLLANATHAIAQRQGEEPELVGCVDIDCRTEDDWAVLRATDNGTGFQTPEGQRLEGVELQQIFQFDFTTKKRQGGLGLAWVRSIIEDIHHGRLVPSNRGEERGAVMEVFLPPPPPEEEGFTPSA